MGDKIRTIQNLEIIKSDLENNLMYVKGSVPGSKNSIVLIQKNAKKINRITTLEKSKKFNAEVSQTTTKSKDKTTPKAAPKKAGTTQKTDKKEDKKK